MYHFQNYTDHCAHVTYKIFPIVSGKDPHGPNHDTKPFVSVISHALTRKVGDALYCLQNGIFLLFFYNSLLEIKVLPITRA